MLKKILLILVVVIGVLSIVIFLRPNEFRVSRSITINAAPAVVFAHVNDQHRWVDWSPWAKLDPAMKMTFEGPDTGTGAAYAWVGNQNVGAGRSTITESRPNEFIQFKLEFFKPFKGTNMSEFTFKPEGGGTRVIWEMYGPNNFISKAVGLFMNCEKMVGGQFEQGLAQLKTVSEG